MTDEAVKRFLKLSLTVPTFFNIILFVVTHECGTQIDAWLSLVERCVRDAEVAGSNPVASTKKTPKRCRLKTNFKPFSVFFFVLKSVYTGENCLSSNFVLTFAFIPSLI